MAVSFGADGRRAARTQSVVVAVALGKFSTICAAVYCRRPCSLLLLIAWLALPRAERVDRVRARRGFPAGDSRCPAAIAARADATDSRGIFGDVLRNLGTAALRVASRLICLPFEAVQNRERDRAHRLAGARVEAALAAVDRIERTSHRGARGEGATAAWYRTKAAPIAALAIAAALILFRADALALARCRGCSLGSSLQPSLRDWSAPTRGAAARRAADRLRAPEAARRTWAWFEQFVSAEDNWLPPDHFQEYPVGQDHAPHLVDQHRHGPARESRRARSRLRFAARRLLAATRHLRQLAETRTLSRPHLQLVRHAHAASRCSQCTSRRWTAATSSATY